MTLDQLLADLDRELARTWGPEAVPVGAPGEVQGEAPVPAAAAPGGERCLLVSIDGRRFGVPARSVVAVSELPPVSAVPFSPPWLRGLARAAGGVVAVVDLARLVSPATGPPPGTPADTLAGTSAGTPAAGGDDPSVRETLLVVRTSDASLDAGLAVRGIARLVALADAQLAPDAILDVDRLLRGAHQELRA